MNSTPNLELPGDNIAPLVQDPDRIRIGIIGSSKGNGHPFSWSAIINGYDRIAMRTNCPFPAIPEYLDLEPSDSFPLAGVQVSHVFCEGDGGFTATQVAESSLIPNVVESPEELIGQVDAIIIATDRGSEHVSQCRPFVEAGIPIFVDKPLATTLEDIQVFAKWARGGVAILSSSSMRYASEFKPYHRSGDHTLGDLCFVTSTAIKAWDTYGMHALEAIYPILGSGFVSVRNLGSKERALVHLAHNSGADAMIAVYAEAKDSLGRVQLIGTSGTVQLHFKDTFISFKSQIEDFVRYLRTGVRPYPFDETIELSKLLLASNLSLQSGGRPIPIDELN